MSALSPAHAAFGRLPHLRANKYGAKRVRSADRADGEAFDSKAEAKRYDELLLMEKAGEIIAGSIRRQVRYDIFVNGLRICAYVADFVYARPDGATVVEDTKGVRTREYALKKKLMLAVHGVAIEESGRQRKRRRPGHVLGKTKSKRSG